MDVPPRLDRLPSRTLPGGLTLYEARAPRARLLGLMGLAALDPDSGLWLPRTRSVHTCGMRLALDLLWLDRDSAVVRRDDGVGPGRLRACRNAVCVVEVPAGAGARWAATLVGFDTMEG